MPIHLTKHNLSYFSVPKVACTSLKRFFFEIENGFPFRSFRLNGKRYRIHDFAQSTAFAEGASTSENDRNKIAVVRDPWRRILSCYASKVVANKVLHNVEFNRKQKRLGCVPDPSIDNFVDLLKEYRAASWEVRHHSRPLSYFLGSDPAYFEKVFSISQLPEMVEYVSDIVGSAPTLPHVNKKTAASVNLSAEETARNKEIIEKIYSDDVVIFGDFM